jgi:hypothetical protein
MHVYGRPIYIVREGEQFRVKCYRGFVTAPVVRDFATHAEANQFAMRKLSTKYYARACVIDETKKVY